MPVLGLAPKKKVGSAPSKNKSAKASSSQSDDAKAILEQMEERGKTAPDSCLFC